MLNSKSEVILIFSVELSVPVYFINNFYHLNFKIIVRSINTLSHVYNQQRFFSNKLWIHLIRFSFKRINKIIAQSAGMKEDLITNFKLKESEIVLIPNPAYNFSNRKNVFYDDELKKKEILFVGRLTQSKGLFYLLNAFQLALEKVPGLYLRIVGTGELQEDIQTKINEMGLSYAISLEGFQEDLVSYYTKARATLLTSLYEGFPNVLVESMLIGTPVISFDCKSGPKDIIIPGVNGILVKHLNVTDFAQAIVDILSGNKVFEKQLIIDSCNRFNINTIINRYIEVLFN